MDEENFFAEKIVLSNLKLRTEENFSEAFEVKMALFDIIRNYKEHVDSFLFQRDIMDIIGFWNNWKRSLSNEEVSFLRAVNKSFFKVIQIISKAF